MASTTARLMAVPTRAELLAADEMIDVYVAEIPKKRASMVLSAIKTIPGQNLTPLSHLRRFAKPEVVPDRVRALTTPDSSSPTNLSPSADDEEFAKLEPEEIMHVLLCPTELMPKDELSDLITKTLVGFRPIKVAATPVPLFAPRSVEQAANSSVNYWPTIYMNSNTFGPHPVVTSRNELQMSGNAAAMMELANAVGVEAREHGLGCGCGVVVVERTSTNPAGTILAVAGDGRWIGQPNKSGPGQVGCHAVLRALSFVARNRRKVAGMTKYDDSDAGKAFAGEPLTPLEKKYYCNSPVEPNGYLCLNLEFWITHEPCTMCSMALLHSRTARIIYGKRMVKTGAMRVNPMAAAPPIDRPPVRKPDHSRLAASESGLDYGLFWRDDLNWRFLCWEWQDEEESNVANIDENTHV